MLLNQLAYQTEATATKHGVGKPIARGLSSNIRCKCSISSQPTEYTTKLKEDMLNSHDQVFKVAYAD